jgi:hypothetical protein
MRRNCGQQRAGLRTTNSTKGSGEGEGEKGRRQTILSTLFTSSETIDTTFPTEALSPSSSLSPPSFSFFSLIPDASLRFNAFANTALVNSERSRIPMRRAKWKCLLTEKKSQLYEEE